MFCRDLHWSPFWVLLLAARFSQCLVASVDVRTFQDPPREYRPKFRYWLPDASVPAERVADDISNLASARAGGLEFLPFYLYGLPQVENPRPPTSWTEYGFGTPAFSDILKSSLQAANDSKVLIDFALGASEGQGVPLPPGTPGLAVELLMGNATVHSGQTFSGSVPQPAPVLSNLLSGAGFQLSLEQFGTPNLTAVSAMRVKSQTVENITIGDYVVPLETYVMDESSFIDLTPVARNGTLKWTAPADNSSWRVFTFWEKYTNQRSCAAGVNATNFLGNGSWTVDHFSKTGAKRITDFWDEYLLSDTTIASLLQTVGQYAWEDSMEMLASLYWTPGFLDRFEATCGYSLVKYLPAMFSYKNLWNQLLPPYLTQFKVGGYTADGDSLHSLDYRAVLNAGYKQYLTHFERWSHQRGFNYSSQPAYNIPLQMLSDVPLMDAPEGESLGFEDNIDAYRQFSGPAHLTGRNVLSSELGAVSTAAYSQVIPDLLFRLKRSLAGGMTMHVLHGFPYSGDYPQTTWPGYTPFYYLFTDMWNEKQPCWKHMPDVLDYIARNQLVLQQGVPQIDLAFYLYTSAWFPDTQYNSTNLESLGETMSFVLSDQDMLTSSPGYTYDYLGPENLASNDAFVRDDLLGPDRAAYKALIIDNQNIMTVEAAKKIIRLTEAGLPVILVGAAPKQPYPYTEAEENKLAAEISKLLSLANVSQIDSNDALPGLLESLGITPRVSMICSAQGVHPLQRHNAERQTEYVYFYNDRAINVECNATIKMDGNVMPSWLNAWTGVEQQIVQYKLASDAITVPVNLKANQTNILALRAEDYSSPSNCKAVRLTSNVVSLNLIDNKAVVKVSGPASVVWSDGHIDSYSPTLPQTSNLTVWNIVIEDWHSSTNKSSTETVIDHHFFTLQHLVPWTDLGLKKVGGIGRYTTNLTIPTPEESSATTLGGILSLGPIVHTARVFIDSIQLPAIDPANPVVDITDYIKPGTPAELMVEVTTPLFNRIKADANSTMMVGVTAAQIQPLYASLDPKEYGLLGPVTVDWIAVENATCVAD